MREVMSLRSQKSTFARSLALALSLWGAVLVIGAGGCPLEEDPGDADASETQHSGPAMAELGFYFTDSYSALMPDDELPVVNGLQGGTWTMPVIRMENLGSFATVDCSITMVNTGEVVGFMKAKTKFFLSPDGFYEALNVPIPVFHPDSEGSPIDDLYGQPATVKCSVTDRDNRVASFELVLTLIQGQDP